MLEEHQIATIEVIRANLKCNHYPSSSSSHHFAPIFRFCFHPAVPHPPADVGHNRSYSFTLLAFSLSPFPSHPQFRSLLLPFLSSQCPLSLRLTPLHLLLCFRNTALSPVFNPALCLHYQIFFFHISPPHCHCLSMLSFIALFRATASPCFIYFTFLLLHDIRH